MKLAVKILVMTSLMLFISVGLSGQVTGMWKTIDDRDGSEKSIIEIYEKGGKYHGRVTKLLDGSTYTTCENCPGDQKGKPLVGMTIMYDLVKTPTGGTNGKVMDPNNGKIYDCYVELVSPDRLKLRGYIGISALGRSQIWQRVN